MKEIDYLTNFEKLKKKKKKNNGINNVLHSSFAAQDKVNLN